MIALRYGQPRLNEPINWRDIDDGISALPLMRLPTIFLNTWFFNKSLVDLH
jgi:hypothetical protein